jgi:hypothetical protein
MLKFLLIVALITYLVYKIGSFFFRAGASSRQFRQSQPNSNSHVGANGKQTRKGKFKGGEYVDYEEVK